MDFEEQLEKAERLDSPSLVGSSMRSADDSPHQNYIHPEKYRGVPKAKTSKRSILNSSIGASLDDLISEGALLGSEEDFDRFLDDSGRAKNPAKFHPKPSLSSPSLSSPSLSSPSQSQPTSPEKVTSGPIGEHTATVSAPVDPITQDPLVPAGSIYETENYSTPNLSEYQLDHQISDHSELLDSVKSYDLSKLPSSDDREKAKSNNLYAASKRAPNIKPDPSPKKNSNSAFAASPEISDAPLLVGSDSIHTPYFQRDGRSQTRARQTRDDRSRSRSRSAQPHLARGDTYKSTHVEPPTKYELPPGMALDEEEDGDDRRTRQSKPTMGDSIAAAEARGENDRPESITREPSLVTTGDYTNFNADIPSRRLDERTLFSVRSESATNYLRSISRSRLRQTNLRESSSVNEKLDSDPHELAEEGALISDDPYGQMSDLDTMLKKVLKSPLENADDAQESKNLINDVPAEKGTEIKEQLTGEIPASPVMDNEGSNERETPFHSDKETKNDDLYLKQANKQEEGGAGALENPTDFTKDSTAVMEELEIKDEESPALNSLDLKSGTVEQDEAEYGTTEPEAELDAAGVTNVPEKVTQVEPETTQVEPETTQVEPETTQVEPETTQVEPETTQVEPETTQVEPETTQVEPETTQVDPETTQVEPETTQVEPETTQADEQEASAVEVKSASAEKETSGEEDHSTDNEIEGTKNAAQDEIGSGKELADSHVDGFSKETEMPAAVDADAMVPDGGEQVTEQSMDSLAKEESMGVTTNEIEKDEAADVSISEASGSEVAVTDPQTDNVQDSEVSTSEDIAETAAVLAADEGGAEEVKEDSHLALDIPETGVEAEENVTKSLQDLNIETSENEVTKTAEENEQALEPHSSGVASPAHVSAKEEATEEEIFDVSPEELRAHLKSLPIYLFTSLAGGMQIIQRTNRLATILQGNGIKFEYRDLGTDEEAKKIWRRYAQGKLLPGVVRGDDFIGDWKYIDEINEDYRLQEVLYETI